ncbi:MAG: DUF3040 domain-containing protein [Bifidobacteriaceae bacterium]|jgi:hypothetical protein|nr:DUF3040 domain-containing protein [Bifidobacteriaceae bacterium]
MPLSEYEQRVLDQLEAQLASEDPEVGTRLATGGAPRRGRIALGAFGVVMGLALLILGVAISQLWVSLAGFLAMFFGAYFALTKPKALPAPSPPAPGRPKKPRKPGLSDRFEKRIDGDGII